MPRLKSWRGDTKCGNHACRWKYQAKAYQPNPNLSTTMDGTIKINIAMKIIKMEHSIMYEGRILPSKVTRHFKQVSASEKLSNKIKTKLIVD